MCYKSKQNQYQGSSDQENDGNWYLVQSLWGWISKQLNTFSLNVLALQPKGKSLTACVVDQLPSVQYQERGLAWEKIRRNRKTSKTFTCTDITSNTWSASPPLVSQPCLKSSLLIPQLLVYDLLDPWYVSALNRLEQSAPHRSFSSRRILHQIWAAVLAVGDGGSSFGHNCYRPKNYLMEKTREQKTGLKSVAREGARRLRTPPGCLLKLICH